MLRHFRSHPQHKSRKATKHKTGDAANDTSDGEDEDDKWPETTPSRYFHNAAPVPFLPLSPPGTSSRPSQPYYTSSHRH